MADKTHVELVCRGAASILRWRRTNPGRTLDLAHANLTGENLSQADLSGANLVGADLNRANLVECSLVKANLERASLEKADLGYARLSGANFTRADLHGARLRPSAADNADFTLANLRAANLRHANLSQSCLNRANLIGADLERACLERTKLHRAHLEASNLLEANLSGAELVEAKLAGTVFRRTRVADADFRQASIQAAILADTDLSRARGLETVQHFGTSSLGIDTILESRGEIPEQFLTGCGIPVAMIEQIPNLINADLVGQSEYYSCFISYSRTDEAFATKLHRGLRNNGVRAFFAPVDMQPARRIDDQISDAIQASDRLLIVLSKDSIESNWVQRELKLARARERQEERHILLPISLVPFEGVCFSS
ncbi:MAG: toll/interleukin-1 receptor domain-containing protein [bacterium]|nr:toll/interleukin-1 receptor domain-containing protein [bacterium]